MFYKIIEISTAPPHTYVLVRFWPDRAAFQRAEPPVLTNDFLLQLRPTGQRIVTNPQGWPKRTDGVFVDPDTLDPGQPEPAWQRELYTVDLPAEIKKQIAAYWQRAQERGERGSNIDTAIRTDLSDPHGVLARPDVIALRGAEVELE